MPSDKDPRYAIEVVDDRVALNIPAGRFTSTLIDDWSIRDELGSSSGRLLVEPWSSERKRRYRNRLRLHRLVGRHLEWLHKRWNIPVWMEDNYEDGERLPDTVITWKARFARWLNATFAVYPPAERDVTVSRCSFDGHFSAVYMRGRSTDFNVREVDHRYVP